ncbi:hypothetical protein [Tunicatimonas pelagia]|uniref:hypothetical protein n=1 Tax=Tunicatimonas pelagia TaxID=931531 RepID=UPI002665A224|nr:hypothetical protein [Tunicatimonas pelagia]WKN43264.1 hypothetical protein P0M28_29920 [Tunicatimonas pelagia]
MAVIFTFMLLIGLELAGLYVAGGIGHAIRSAFTKSPTQKSSPRVRGLNVLIGYGVIFSFFILLSLL